MSGTPRMALLLPVCQVGLAKYVLYPPPLEPNVLLHVPQLHAVSVAGSPLRAAMLVPPIAVTYGSVAGHSALVCPAWALSAQPFDPRLPVAISTGTPTWASSVSSASIWFVLTRASQAPQLTEMTLGL